MAVHAAAGSILQRLGFLLMSKFKKSTVHHFFSLFEMIVFHNLSNYFFFFSLANVHVVRLVSFPLLKRVRHPVQLHVATNAVRESIQKN